MLMFRMQANYAVWKTIQKLIPYLTDDFKVNQQNFLNATHSHSEKLLGWEGCINEATNR